MELIFLGCKFCVEGSDSPVLPAHLSLFIFNMATPFRPRLIRLAEAVEFVMQDDSDVESDVVIDEEGNHYESDSICDSGSDSSSDDADSDEEEEEERELGEASTSVHEEPPAEEHEEPPAEERVEHEQDSDTDME